MCSQIITKQEFNSLLGPASMHALGHIAANLSFAAVAISLTHTVKTLEPAFNVLLSRLILGTVTPTPVMLSLVPIMVRGVRKCGPEVRRERLLLLCAPHSMCAPHNLHGWSAASSVHDSHMLAHTAPAVRCGVGVRG